ncbi:MFS transporter [Pantoea agglomerans]|jgi:macrolide resistance protein|uniref:MFS transporter n=1 Tax=Enterobacter agglomerans TaxID=549 RepID=UPI0010095408|nr:MFS transporter [Pantoea agglomerans]QAV47502.1 MFS transporter [Pantoea agglomerans]QAV52293.1 MFS transporter [Pantoea agglomerans]
MSLLPKRHRAPMLGVIAASGISLFGNSVAAVALPWLVLDMTGSAAWTGVAAAAGMLPLILGSFLGGALIDRFGARPVAVIADLASAGSMALIVWLADHQWIGLAILLALIALGALFDGPGMTAQESRYPELARLARMPLERATALNKLVGSLANIVAPAAAGLGIALFGPERTLLLTAGCSLLAAVLDRLSLPGRRLRCRSQDASRSVDVLAGARFLMGDPLLRSLLLLGSAVVGLLGALDAVVMPVRIREAGLVASSLGWFLAAAGSGAIVGALAFGRLGPRLWLRRIVLTCLSLEVMAFCLLTLTNDEGLRLLAGILAGLGSGPLNPLLTTVLLRRAPIAIRSRVLGASTAAALVATPLAVLLAGGAIDLTGSRPVLTAMALVAIVLLAAAAWLPGLRGLDNLTHVSASDFPLSRSRDNADDTPNR